MVVKSVLIASDFANINGGQAKVAVDSARLLAEAGIDVTFFAATGAPDPALSHPRITLDLLDQKDILSEPSRITAMTRGIWNRAARDRLSALAARFDPTTTILHCHGYAKALSPAIGPMLTDGPLRAVYTMHEYFLACPNGGFYDYQRNEICTRRALGAACLATHCDVRHRSHKAWRVVRQAATWGPGRIPRRMRDVIYISETQKQALAPYLSETTRLHHVPNPIARPEAPPVRAADNEIFLFVGRLNPEKGGLMFAQAARAAGVQAVFVGDGPEADAIRAANPEARILGWQPASEVQTWLRQARALVFPSLWYETFGLVALEALAQHVPVVCGAWNAASEAVEHGRTGILYDRPDTASLTAAITACRTLDFKPERDVLGPVAPEAHVARLMDIYETILQTGAQAA